MGHLEEGVVKFLESSLNQIWDTQNLILALIEEFSPSTIKLQKLLFIAQYGSFNLPANLVFAPFLYGPFCVELSNEILPALQKEGLIQTIRYRKDQRSPTIKNYSLTELGKEMLQQWLTNNTGLNRTYRDFIHVYKTMTTEEIVSESYEIFSKTINPRLLYFDQQMLHESVNQLDSRINEKIRLKIPLEPDMISDPISEFILEDFKESIPIYLSKNELSNAFKKEMIGIGASLKIYGNFHQYLREDGSELIGLFSHHCYHKNPELNQEINDYDIICKLTKYAEICYYDDFLGHICEIGGTIVEKKPIIMEPVYILGYYPREYQA
jgi:DNA-binding PadR family transcriptional regulator